MAFLRFSRDKRGYEHVYLVQPAGRRGKTLPRLLYWFRTPPNIKVGREPFDESVRRALEAQHPDVAFNWSRLLATPFPPPDTERWRERRRERAARRAADTEVEVVAGSPDAEGATSPDHASASATPADLVNGTEAPEDQANPAEAPASDAPRAADPGAAAPTLSVGEPRRRHRRRRRRRRGTGEGGVTPPASTAGETNAPDPDRSEDGE